MSINFKRGKDLKQRKTRSDKGKKRGGAIRSAISEANEGRKRRKSIKKRKEELELRVLESQARELDEKEAAAKRKKTTDKAKGIATLAGLAGTGVALGTKKGRKATRKALAKGATETGKLVGKGIRAAGSAAVSGAASAGKAVGKAAVEGAKEAADEAKTATTEKITQAKKSIGQKVQQKKAEDIAKVKDLGRRLKERRNRLLNRKKKKKKKEGDFHLEPVSINFASKVKVKSFRRKDGTVVKASTRRVKKKKKTVGQKLGDLGKGLIPLATAAATGAQAVSTISDAQLRRKQTRRELSAVGEARKFLGVAGSAGSGFRSVSAGIDTLNNLGSAKNKLGLRGRELSLKEKRLNLDSRKAGTWQQVVDQTKRKNDINERFLKEEIKTLKRKRKGKKKKSKK